MTADGCCNVPGMPLAGTSPSPGVSPSVTLPTIPVLTPPTSGGGTGNTTLPANATGGSLVIRAFWATTPKEGVCYKFNGTGFEADNSTTYGGCLWGRADTAVAAWDASHRWYDEGAGRQRPVKLLPAAASIAGRQMLPSCATWLCTRCEPGQVWPLAKAPHAQAQFCAPALASPAPVSSGSQKVGETAYNSYLSDLCGSPDTAGEKIGKDLLKGGEDARMAWVATLDKCPGAAEDLSSAFIAYVNPRGNQDVQRVIE